MRKILDLAAARLGRRWTPSAAALAVVLVVFMSGAAHAQRLGVSLDAAPLVRGAIVSDEENPSAEVSAFSMAAAVEYLMIPHYSVGARIDFASEEIKPVATGTDIEVAYFSFVVHARAYPLVDTKMEGLFFDAGLGIANTDFKGKIIDSYEDDADYNPDTLSVSFNIGVGYRFVLGRLFFEPALYYVLEKTPLIISITSYGQYAAAAGVSSLVVYGGWQPCLSVGMLF